MTRRLATVFLAVLIAVAHLAVCPSAEASCLAMRDQSHDCCAKSDALAPAKCCCTTSPAAHSPSELHASAPTKHTPQVEPFGGFADGISSPRIGCLALARAARDAGRAPPPRGPLLHQFTSRLL